MSNGRTIAIGDIHGCSAALDGLLEALDVSSEDTVIVLGDVVDRGPDVRGVLERLLALENACRLVAILGNHEAMMLEAIEHGHGFAAWTECGGAATLASYGNALSNVPDEHMEFLRRMRLTYEVETHFFIHANYVATLPLDRQPVSVALWEHLTHFVPPPHLSGKCAVVGHTPQQSGEVLDLGHIICLDTYCVGGGRLTAMSFPQRQLWQVDRKGSLCRDGELLPFSDD